MLTPVWCWASVSDPFVISGFSVNTIKSSFCIILSWWIMLPLKKTSNWLGKLEWCCLSSHILYTSPEASEYWRIHAHYSNRLTVPPFHTLAFIALSFDKIAHMNFIFLLWHSLAIIILFQPMLRVWICETLRVDILESSDIASRWKNEAVTSSHLHHGFICASECAVPAS